MLKVICCGLATKYLATQIAKLTYSHRMLIEKLEILADAFESKGVNVRSNLAPGATDSELELVAEQYGVELPDDYRTLYKWHNGNADLNARNVFKFRDNAFLSIKDFQNAKFTIDIYAEPSPITDGVIDLSTALPLALFEGAVYVTPGKGAGISTLSPQPVVSVFQGIDVFFLSIETMVDTCIAWVAQPDWKQFSTAPNEHQLWAQHNPGVFDRF